MAYKDEIKTQLDLLKRMGKDRRAIESDLGYSEFYIDQALSKGGNEKLLQALIDYKERLEDGSFDANPTNMLEIINRNSIAMERFSIVDQNHSATILDQQRLISNLTQELMQAKNLIIGFEQKKSGTYKVPDDLLTLVNEMNVNLNKLSARFPEGTTVPRSGPFENLSGKGQTAGKR